MKTNAITHFHMYLDFNTLGVFSFNLFCHCTSLQMKNFRVLNSEPVILTILNFLLVTHLTEKL